MSNPGKKINMYNIPKLVKLAYLESFTARNITSGFEKPGIWPFNEMAFSDEDFAPINVYASNNSVNVKPNPETSTVALEPQPSTSVPLIDMNEADSREQSHFLLQNSQYITRNGEPSTSAAETQSEPSAHLPITPEVIRPYPTAVKNTNTNKGRKPSKSRIYTDTPEKTELEERHRQKELKKIEQERKARAKAVKRSLKELGLRQKKKKAKQVERDEDSEESSEESQISLRESSTFPIDFETDEETDDRSIIDNTCGMVVD